MQNLQDVSFYIYSVFKRIVSKNIGQNTFDAVWRVISWSFLALYEGVWPAFDPSGVRYSANSVEGRRAGTPLAPMPNGNLFGMLWILKSDLDWAYDRLGLANYRAVRQGPCVFCPCNSVNMFWSDLRERHAPWVDNVYTTVTWLARNPNRIALFNLPGVTALNYMCDVMHCKHLGTDMYFAASVLWALCYIVLPRTPSQNLEHVMGLVRAWKGATVGCAKTYNNVKLSMFTNPDKPRDDYPKLKGRAWEIRNFMKPLLHVWKECMDPTVIWHKHITAGLKRAIEIEDVLDRNPRVAKLPDAEAQAYKTHVFAFLAHFTWLAQYFISLPVGERLRLFDVTIKGHYMAHSALTCHHQNPRMGWCYMGEDYMKIMKSLMQSCVRGNAPQNATLKMLTKLRLAFRIDVDDSEDLLF